MHMYPGYISEDLLEKFTEASFKVKFLKFVWKNIFQQIITFIYYPYVLKV